MKKWILIAAAVMFAAGLVLGSAYVAWAQGNELPTPLSGTGWMGRGMMSYSQPFTGTMPFGRGPMMGGGQLYTGTLPLGPGLMMTPGSVHEQMWTAVAQQLGLTYDQLQTELGTKTLAQLAQEKNVSLDALKNVAKTAWTNAINQLVQQGKLTREQADWMIQRMDAMGWPMFGNAQGWGPDGCGMMGRPQGQGFRGRGMPFGGRQS